VADALPPTPEGVGFRAATAVRDLRWFFALSSTRRESPSFTVLTRRVGSRSHTRTQSVLGTGVDPTTPTQTSFSSNTDIYVESYRRVTYTEAVTPPTQMHNIGTPRPKTFETPSRRAVVSRSEDNSESPLEIGVTAVWPRPQNASRSDGLRKSPALANAIGLSCR
jgi:hypothetical protein